MTTAGDGRGEELGRYRILGRNPRSSNLCIDGVNYFPGDEVEATAKVMLHVLAMGKAELIEDDEVRTQDAPEPEHRDPPRARGRRGRRA